MSARWRVERAGSPGAYLAGWFAQKSDGTVGAWFPSQRAAMEFAARQADEAARGPAMVDILGRWGIVARPRPRPVIVPEAFTEPLTPASLRELKPARGQGVRTSPEDIDRIVELRGAGLSQVKIAKLVGVSQFTVSRYLRARLDEIHADRAERHT